MKDLSWSARRNRLQSAAQLMLVVIALVTSCAHALEYNLSSLPVYHDD